MPTPRIRPQPAGPGAGAAPATASAAWFAAAPLRAAAAIRAHALHDTLRDRLTAALAPVLARLRRASADRRGRGASRGVGPGSGRVSPARRLRRAGLGTLIALLAGMGGAGAALAERLALVVGIDSYDAIYDLDNAAGDAEAVAAALERLDFEVTLLTEASGAAFAETLEAFAEAADAREADTVLFYFSGHGFQLDGANYLVPADASLASREAIEAETLRLDRILGRLEARGRQTIVFLDACRNNPLPPSMRGEGREGLAQIETGSGSFIAFATQPNNITFDGAGDHSPFTAALLDYIETPGISISDMMIQVRNEVETNTLRQQTPWDQSSLRSQFYFSPVYETTASLTAADYEMLASLDPERRAQFLRLLGETGISFEIGAIEEAEADIVAAGQLLIGDASDDLATAIPVPDLPEETDAGEAIALARAEDTAAPEATPRPAARGEELTASTAPSLQILPAEPEAEPEPEAVAEAPAPDPQPDPQSGALAEADPEPAAPPVRLADRPSDAPATAAEAEAARTLALATEALDRAAGATAEPAAPAAGTTVTAAVAPAATVTATEVPMADSARPLARIVGQQVLDEAEAEPEAVAAAAPEPEPEIEIPANLTRAVQSELARLGCYRAAVDGIWGRMSSLATVRYYTERDLVPDNLQPTEELYRLLVVEDEVVCSNTVAVARATVRPESVRAPAPAPEQPRAQPTRRIIQQPQSSGTGEAPAPRRTIGGGVSGVFR